jgi:serine/threonine protein kinase
MASALNQPHILTVHDVGEFEGRQYLVTEFVDGGTLKDWAVREKPSWRQIAELITGIADGPAAAHEAGILHRDIKPANILVAKNGYANLADFGLAKASRIRNAVRGNPNLNRGDDEAGPHRGARLPTCRRSKPPDSPSTRLLAAALGNFGMAESVQQRHVHTLSPISRAWKPNQFAC